MNPGPEIMHREGFHSEGLRHHDCRLCREEIRQSEHDAIVATLRVENVRLAARVAEAEQVRANLADRLKSTQDWVDRAESERDTARAEVESLKAQLAEIDAVEPSVVASMPRKSLERRARRLHAQRNAAEEQLRVAREALSGMLEWSYSIPPYIPDDLYDKVRAALSASAPKPEPRVRDGVACLCLAHDVKHTAQCDASQATPVCDDVTLMKVAERVRSACANHWNGAGLLSASRVRDGILSIDLAAIVTEAKR